MLLEVKELTKKYRQHTAVETVSFGIEPGSCVALLGRNGAGKTTTLQMIAGLLEQTSGKVTFMDKPYIDKKHIGFLPQYPQFFSWMTAEQYLQFVGSLSEMEKNEVKEKIAEVLSFTGLDHARKRKISGFSGGMKQRLGLAQALIHNPTLLLLDEPVSALDPEGRREVLQLLFQLKEKMTILFSTHVLHDAEQVCDSVVMLREGNLVWSGSLEQLKSENEELTFFIEADSSLEPVIQEAKDIVSVHYYEKEKVDVTFVNVKASQQFLQTCVESSVIISQFQRKRDTLEDMYIKVMES